MSRKKKRKYTLGKRLDKAYENYVKRYNAKKEEMERKGYQMADTLLNRREYEMNRQAYIDAGQKININQTLVSDQAYVYSLKTARHLKKFAKEHDLKSAELSITQLRQGEGLTDELAKLNEALKEQGMSGYERQKYITYEVFGSD